MTKMQAIETCAKAMLQRQGCDPAAWFTHPENTELAANIVTALEALGLLRPTERIVWKEASPTDGLEQTSDEPDPAARA